MRHKLIIVLVVEEKSRFKDMDGAIVCEDCGLEAYNVEGDNNKEY